MLVDTGSSVTLVRQSVIDQANISETRPPSSRLKSATGHEIPVTYEAKLWYNIGGQAIKHWSFVCPNMIHEALLGYDFITQHDVVINGTERTICCKDADKIPLRESRLTMQIMSEDDRNSTRSAGSYLNPAKHGLAQLQDSTEDPKKEQGSRDLEEWTS